MLPPLGLRVRFSLRSVYLRKFFFINLGKQYEYTHVELRIRYVISLFSCETIFGRHKLVIKKKKKKKKKRNEKILTTHVERVKKKRKIKNVSEIFVERVWVLVIILDQTLVVVQWRVIM